jgi:hypothetical protein
MNISTASPTAVLIRIGLTMSGFVAVSCIADDSTSEQTSEQKLAGLAPPLPSAIVAPTGEQPCAGRTPAVTLLLQDAGGNALQLAFAPGCGWKYVVSGKSSGGEDKLALQKRSFSSVASQTDATTAAIDDPMAVFIDGPTGYTFAWIRDAGWKFIGHVTNEKR